MLSHSASSEYLTRRAARNAARETLNASDARLAHARLATFGASVVLAIAVWTAGISGWWLLLPAAIFVWLVRRHDRVIRARDGSARGIAFYDRGLARLEDRWSGTGEAGERFRDDRHVYANDLDLFGRGSLFELLSLARTAAGEAMLASWLKSSADAAEIRARQEAVAELGPALDLREQLALSGADVRESVNTNRLIEWASSPMPPLRSLGVFTWLLTAGVLGAILYVAITAEWWPLAIINVLEAIVFRRLREQMNAVVSGMDPESTADFVADALTHRARDLNTVADLLKNLERGGFRSDRLRLLHSRLTDAAVPASRVIQQLRRYADIHDSARNAAIVPLGLFLFGYLEAALGVSGLLQLLNPHVTLAVGRWRRRYGHQVGVWLQTIAEFEALTSLSGYRFEHIEDPFPEIVWTDGCSPPPALFDGVQLRHPLLPAATMVPNDVRLGVGTELLVVSGSNMSGKSTLLRTVGINTVLALAGAPVRASSLRISPLVVGATLRIQDSLLEGRSRFYAEITRIRELADLARGPVPLLFLLDELFHGTNSHDRLMGAAGVLRSLLDRGAIGLITTHDLALTAVADELSPHAANVHFQDQFDGNEIRFDYRMKPGPVTRSNALALMRAVGLDVPSA
jgi:hypothetical protein